MQTLETCAHLHDDLVRVAQSLFTTRRQSKIALRPATPLCSGFARVRSDETFCLEADKCRVHGTDRNVTTGCALDFPAYGHAIRVGRKSYDGEQHDVLQRAKRIWTFLHFLYII